MKISELLTDESKWCKVGQATDSNGNRVPWNSSDAVAWSLLSAISNCYTGEEYYAIRDAVALEVTGRADGSLIPWNSAPERTFADIKALITKLNI